MAAYMMYGRGGGFFSMTAETSRVEAAKVSLKKEIVDRTYVLVFFLDSIFKILFSVGVFSKRRESQVGLYHTSQCHGAI